ncbi:MAG: hypothetical protein Q9190_000300 [Brigantiaea leucoxantha]
MHATSTISTLLLFSPLLSHSLQINRQSQSSSNLLPRQDSYGTPYGNSDPWDDTDPDGTGSTTWLPDDYIGGPDSSSSSSDDTSNESVIATDAPVTDILYPTETDIPSQTDYLPTAIPTGTDELFYGAETAAATDSFATDVAATATDDFFADASSSSAPVASATGAPNPSKAQATTLATKARATGSEASAKTGVATTTTAGEKSQSTAKAAAPNGNSGSKVEVGGSIAALGVMVALAWIY